MGYEEKTREELIAELRGLQGLLDTMRQQTNATEHLMVENSPVAMALYDMGGNIEYLNKKFVDTYGYTLEDIPTLEAWWVKAYPDKAYRRTVMEKWNRVVEKAINKGAEIEAVSYNVTCKNGEVRIVEISGTPLNNNNLVIFNDITERRKIEEALKLSIERYDLIAAGMRDGLWDWDVPNKRVFFSSRWKAMRGFSDEEVSDSEEEWSKGIHPEDAPRVFAKVQEHFEGKTPWFMEEYRIRCKDGTWKWILDRGTALFDAEGKVIRMAGSETDITIRKNLEAEREKLIIELQNALENVKTLSGMLPICASCKKIRDDKGYWNQIEKYVRDHSEAEFTHAICPECAKKLYPKYYEQIWGKDEKIP